MTMISRLSVPSIAAAALLLTACDLRYGGELRRESATIDLEKADTARVELRMGAGELHVGAGTPKLAEADFSYNVPEWKPQVDYHVTSGRGELTISQPSRGSAGMFRNTKYSWDLKVNEQVPVDLAVHLGAGEGNLLLGRLNLRSVSVNVGAGELKVDLRGEPKQSYDVKVQGGVGEATIYLPHDAGISATAAGGIGEVKTTGLEKRDGAWINPDRAQAPVTIHLDVKGGVGEIRLVR